jgi:hypothetical protein
MLQVKRFLNRSLTKPQAALVILAAAGMAALGWLAFNLLTAEILDRRIEAAVPLVCAQLREQRQVLISAVEAYKAHFGEYPPDHVVSRQPLIVDPVKNPLLYELAGVLYNPTNKTFELQNLEAADAKYVKEFFQCEGLKNCSESPDKLKHFLTTHPLPACQLHDDPDVFAVGFVPSYDKYAPEIIWHVEVTSWRYVSSTPTNNPGRFDLWAEVKTKHRAITIGNWTTVD